MALQYGVPLDVLVNKFSHVRFEPSGFTKNPEIPMAKSLIDYIFRFLGARFLSAEQATRGRARPRRPSRQARRGGDGGELSHGGASAATVERDHRLQPAGRRAELLGLRLDHDAQRQLLQMPQLRRDERLLLNQDGPGARDGRRRARAAPDHDGSSSRRRGGARFRRGSSACGCSGCTPALEDLGTAGVLCGGLPGGGEVEVARARRGGASRDAPPRCFSGVRPRSRVDADLAWSWLDCGTSGL